MKVISKEFAQKITRQIKKSVKSSDFGFNVSTKIESYGTGKELWMEIRMTTGNYTPIPHELLNIVQKYGIIMALDPVENDAKTNITINGIEYTKKNEHEIDFKWYDLFILFPLELEIGNWDEGTKKLHDLYLRYVK